MTWPALTAASEGGFEPPRISQIELHCTNLEKAKSFYCSGLRLRLIGEIDDAILLDAGNINLLITLAFVPQRSTTIYFNANDRIHELAHAMAAAGIYFSQPPKCVVRDHYGKDVWLALFKDPWGNSLALLSNMPPQ